MLLRKDRPARGRRSRRWPLPSTICVTVLFLPTTVPVSSRTAAPQTSFTLCNQTRPWCDVPVSTVLLNSGQLRRFRPSLRGLYPAHHWPVRHAQAAPHARKPRPHSAALLVIPPAARILTSRTPLLAERTTFTSPTIATASAGEGQLQALTSGKVMPALWIVLLLLLHHSLQLLERPVRPQPDVRAARLAQRPRRLLRLPRAGIRRQQGDVAPSTASHALKATASTHQTRGSTQPSAAPTEAAFEGLPPSVSVRQSAAAAVAHIGRMVIEGPAAEVGFSRRTDAFHMLVLLAEHRQGLQRGTAYDLLWPEVDPAVDRERFHGPLRELRGKLCQALGRPTSSGKIVIQRLASGYRLNPELVTTDLWQIHDALARAATATAPATRRGALQAAVAAYTGPILRGSPYSWAETAARDLDQKIIKALMQLADLETDPEAAITHLAAAIDIDPYAEHLYRAQMKLFAQHGRAAEIHKTYERLCDVLRELDGALHPADQTTDLYRRLANTSAPARSRLQPGSRQRQRSRHHRT